MTWKFWKREQVDLRFEITRFDLRPGDILVLKHADNLSLTQVERLKGDIALSTGGHRCMVLAGGFEMAVLAAPAGEENAA